MAYLDLSDAGAAIFSPVTRSPALSASGARIALLSPAERAVIRMARRDSLSSVAPVDSLRNRAARFFGMPRANALADPRLEALRRFVVRFLKQGREEGDELRDIGFTASHIQEVLRMAGPPRPAHDVDMSSLVSLLVAAMVGVGAFLWVRSRLGDSFVAAAIVTCFGLPLVVSVRPRARQR